MIKIAIILLNYNNADAVINMVDIELNKLNIPNGTEIIIVDNCSTDDSIISLENWNSNCVILKACENGGYAKGNNIGIRYAEEHGFNYVWILNSDLIFDDVNTLIKMIEILELDNKIGAISPNLYSGKGNELNRNLYRPNVFDLTIGRIRYRRRGRQLDDSLYGLSKNYCYNYKPQGCCMLLSIPIMHIIDYLDENTFLFMEEPILGERLRMHNFRSALCLTTCVIHNHNSDYKSEKHRRQVYRWQRQSEKYYYLKYRRFGHVTAECCQLFTAIYFFVLLRFRRFK